VRYGLHTLKVMLQLTLQRLEPGTAPAADAELQVLNARALFGTLRERDHAGPVERRDGLLGIVFQVLANDQDRLAVFVAVGVREGDIGGQRNVAGHFLPEIAEFVAHVPDVVAGGIDGV